MMDIIGYVLLGIGALSTFLSGAICRKFSWDDSPTSGSFIGVKMTGCAVSFVGVLFIFGMFG